MLKMHHFLILLSLRCRRSNVPSYQICYLLSRHVRKCTPAEKRDMPTCLPLWLFANFHLYGSLKFLQCILINGVYKKEKYYSPAFYYHSWIRSFIKRNKSKALEDNIVYTKPTDPFPLKVHVFRTRWRIH